VAARADGRIRRGAEHVWVADAATPECCAAWIDLLQEMTSLDQRSLSPVTDRPLPPSTRATLADDVLWTEMAGFPLAGPTARCTERLPQRCNASARTGTSGSLTTTPVSSLPTTSSFAAAVSSASNNSWTPPGRATQCRSERDVRDDDPMRHRQIIRAVNGSCRSLGVSSGELSGVPVVWVNMTRNELGLITSVDDNVVDLLGWRPDQLVGAKSSDFLHPEDQASGIAAWVSMATAPGTTGVWRGRYRTAAGTWQWVETTNRFDDDEGIVSTAMTSVSVAQVSIEEELRARTELLTRLSDALPAGLFQIDLERRVMFTNDQLHVIVGVAPAATIDAQLATLLDDDRDAFDAALSTVLAGRPFEDIEIRVAGQVARTQHVCLLSLRALTDGAGAVSGAIGLVSDVTERVQLRRELELRASTDQLTSCLNRAAVLDVLDVLLARRRHSRESGDAVVYVDLDRFKSINDRFGHAAGDRLLTAAADRLRLAVRQGDSIGRMGGDEFLVVCPHVASAADAVAIAERLASFVNHRVDVGPTSVDMHASVGVAWTCEPLDGDTLIARADHAMYESKRSHTDRVTLHLPDTGPISVAATMG